MNFPETNHIHKKPVPEVVESQVKLLEDHLSKIRWGIFVKAYFALMGLVLITVFLFIVVVGLANFLVNLIS